MQTMRVHMHPTSSVAVGLSPLYSLGATPRLHSPAVVHASRKGKAKSKDRSSRSPQPQETGPSSTTTTATTPPPSTTGTSPPSSASSQASSSSDYSPLPATASAPKGARVQQETPQVVVDRIFSRMVACAVLPIVAGFGLLIGIYFLKKKFGDDFPMWPAYLSQAISFGGGLLGISYGALSASWDPNRAGTISGWTEFRANLPLLLELTKKERR